MALANELGHLLQGTRNLPGMDTIKFMPKHAIPLGQTPTYRWIVVDYQLQKSEPHHAHITVGGDCIEFPWDNSTPTADLTTAKLLFNSTTSSPHVWVLTLTSKISIWTCPWTNWNTCAWNLKSYQQ